jgi:DNA-binding NarL/FixJ family response regulator
VLRLVAAGLTSKEIGKKLKISPRTVSKHRENLMRKLQIHDMAGLLRIANSLR